MSVIVLLVYFPYYFAVFDKKPKKLLVIVGDAEPPPPEAEKQEARAESEWEVLVVDPKLRKDLWEKYENSTDKEKQKAFDAIVVIINELKEEQAKHLADGMIKRDGESPNTEHRTKLMLILKKLAARFDSVGKSSIRFCLGDNTRSDCAQGRVATLLESKEVGDIQLALHLVRAYGLVGYIDKIRSLKKPRINRKLLDDIEIIDSQEFEQHIAEILNKMKNKFSLS